MRTQMELDDRTLGAITDSNPGDFAVYRVEGGRLSTLYASDGLAALSGMTREEYDALTREDAAAVILKADQPQVAARLGALLTKKGDGDADITYRIVHKKQGHIWVHARGRLVGSRDGSPVLFVSYSSSSAEASGQSLLLDIDTAILYVIDKGTYEILYANETARAPLGPGDYAGQICYSYISGCTQPCAWCSVPLMKDGKFHVDAAYSPAHERWYSIDCREIDWYGRDAIAVYARDVTDQQKQRQSIEADRNTLDTILGSIPGGVAVFSDRGGKIRLDYTNNGFYELHHGSRAYWDSMSANPVDWLMASDTKNFEQELEKVIRGEKIQGDATYRIIGEDGKTHWVNNQFRRAYVRDGVQYYYAAFIDMDGQIAAERERGEARRMYEAAVEATNLVVWEYDIPEHRVIMAENEFTEYDYRKFGLPKVTENAPQALVPYIDDAYVDDFLEMYRKIDAGEPKASCEVWYKLRPGTEPRCEQISYTAVFDAEGRPCKAYGIGQNITARRHEEESYRQAMRQIAQAADNTLGSFSLNLTTNWCGDGKSIYDFVLKQAESGTADGYFRAFSAIISDDEIRRQSLALLNREGLIQRFQRGEKQVTLEYPVRYRNGEIHWQRGVIDLMRNPKTGDVEALTHALDIDRQKRGEQIAQSVLSDRLDFAALIYPASGDIVFYTVQPTITRVKSGTRCPYEEIRTYLRDQFIPEDERANFDRDTASDGILAQISRDGSSHCYYRRIQDGQETYRHLQYSWLDPSQTAVLVIQSDVTETRRQERRHMDELRRALAAAEQANRAKTDFLSRMSHDMRTPLNGIIGMTYLAGEQQNPPRTADCLAKIDLSSKFLLGLINDVLDMSKAESGAIELHPEPYSMSEFKQYVDAVIRPLCEGKGQKLVTEYVMPEGCIPLIDKLRMNQIVFNLLSNAVKYSPEGSPIRYRDISSLLPDGRVRDRIEVTDQGIGMSPEFQKVLFQPFTQEKRADNSEMHGTGLGLAITKKLLDAMGGSICVESQLGKGTTIKVELVMECASGLPSEKTKTAVQEPQEMPLAGKHILLCEDHPLNQEIAKALLTERGMTVAVANDGAASVKAFENSDVGFFDCVLMDIRMPVMNGYEATRAIRALGRADAESVPILAMTADAFTDDVQRCFDAGMNGHISKPIDPEILYRALAGAIRKRPDRPAE
jgi:signal transduction histidine kinase/PAS domain-containing protein/ActR/RegA family two-component response regulator